MHTLAVPRPPTHPPRPVVAKPREQYAYLLTTKVVSGGRVSVAWVMAREGQDRTSSGTIPVDDYRGASKAALAAALNDPDALLTDFLKSSSTGAILYVSSSTVHDELVALREVFSGLHVERQLPDHSCATPAQREAVRLLSELKVRASSERDPAPHLIATDASMRRKARHAFVACVDQAGRYRTGKVHAKGSVSAELHAFTLAVTEFSCDYSHLHLITDAAISMKMAQRTLRDGKVHVGESGLAAVELHALLRASVDTTITFEWVKSHNDHPLNELADRLAVTARRLDDSGMTRSHQAMCDRIASEATQIDTENAA